MCNKKKTRRTLVDIPSPKPVIKNGDVRWNEERRELTIKLPKGTKVTTVQDTNSIEAVFEAGHILAYFPHDKKKGLDAGEIAIYSDFGNPGNLGGIIHRVKWVDIVKGKRIYTFQGDNVSIEDPWEVTDEHISAVLGVIIYRTRV